MTRNTGNTITGPSYGESREMPWDVMGKALTPKAQTNFKAAMRQSGLDYDVRLLPVVAHDGPEDEPLAMHTFLDAAKSQAVVRPTPDGDRVVGMVGNRFTPIQNRDAFAIGDELVTHHGARISGLADFRHGGASLLVVDLQAPITLDMPDGGQDVTALNLLVKNHHDGNGALTMALTPVRLACTNSLPMAISEAARSWKIHHTPNAQGRVELAARAIRKALGYREQVQAVAQQMLNQPMVDAEFAKIVSRLWKVDPKATGKVAERRRDVQGVVMDLWQKSPTLDGIRGTRWGAYNALTEYMDHFRPVKGDGEKAQAVARAEGALEGPNVRSKDRVWRMLAPVS